MIVDAVIDDDLPPDALIDVEAEWGPVRTQATERARSEGRTLPDHWHWNWAKKAPYAGMLAYRSVGLERDEQTQGLMMLLTVGHTARLESSPGKPVVYVEFLEVAPWNVAALDPAPRYGGVGTRLLQVAALIQPAGEVPGASRPPSPSSGRVLLFEPRDDRPWPRSWV